MSKDSGVPLAQFIKHLRNELQDAEADGKDSALRFELGPIELELEVGVTADLGGSFGVKVWVLELGGDASRSAQHRQRVKLSLIPRREQGGGPVLVNDVQATRPTS